MNLRNLDFFRGGGGGHKRSNVPLKTLANVTQNPKQWFRRRIIVHKQFKNKWIGAKAYCSDSVSGSLIEALTFQPNILTAAQYVTKTTKVSDIFTFKTTDRKKTGVFSFSMCARHFIVDHSAGKTWTDLTGTSIFCVTLMDAQLTLNITSISGNKDRVTQNVTLYNTRIGWVMRWPLLNLEWLWMERGPVKASFNVWWMIRWRDGVIRGVMAFFFQGLNGGVLALFD